MIFSSAREQQFPEVFCGVHTKWGTPISAVILQVYNSIKHCSIHTQYNIVKKVVCTCMYRYSDNFVLVFHWLPIPTSMQLYRRHIKLHLFFTDDPRTLKTLSSQSVFCIFYKLAGSLVKLIM